MIGYDMIDPGSGWWFAITTTPHRRIAALEEKEKKHDKP
jgi:hypothetical protein